MVHNLGDVDRVPRFADIPLDSMNNPPETSKLPSDSLPPTGAGEPEQAGTPTPARRLTPSARMTAVLAAGMLAIGVVVGAAIGPAPSPSFAIGRLLPLLPALLRGEQHAPAAQPPASTPQPTPTAEAEGSRVRRHRHHHAVESAVAQAPAEASAPAASKPSPTPTKTVPLPPVSKVWLIELGNSSFAEVAAHASTAPYITASALPAGTLLSGWSALEGSALANSAPLIAGSSPQLVNTIVQPPCPEGAAGAGCQPDTPGALTAASEFLQATLPTITSTAGYRENGLVVITFASIVAPGETGLPAGTASATLTSQPPTGVLLVSPFVAAGAKSTVTFNPTSPKQSLEKLLRR
jgi:hypothetical protein